jgi:hypothetical protein
MKNSILISMKDLGRNYMSLFDLVGVQLQEACMYIIVLTFISFLLSSKPFCQTLASILPPHKQVPPCKVCPYKQELDLIVCFFLTR